MKYNVEGRASDSSVASKQDFEAQSNKEASSERNPLESKSDSENINPFMKQASKWLASIPAVPAFASEFPTKEIARGLHPATQSSSSAHSLLRVAHEFSGATNEVVLYWENTDAQSSNSKSNTIMTIKEVVQLTRLSLPFQLGPTFKWATLITLIGQPLEPRSVGLHYSSSLLQSCCVNWAKETLKLFIRSGLGLSETSKKLPKSKLLRPLCSSFHWLLCSSSKTKSQRVFRPKGAGPLNVPGTL
ncbi:hypothetical protein VNO77_18831 [Canavalia gladiata]|uniref:Uncharacterized protein n=1 Tax=Canavalia gladiata TaxID=3824 RepID=A0AAN9LPZ3_CANGL